MDSRGRHTSQRCTVLQSHGHAEVLPSAQGLYDAPELLLHACQRESMCQAVCLSKLVEPGATSMELESRCI